MIELHDKTIIDAWHKNAQPWIRAIREEAIESRTLVTNQAIVEAVQEVPSKTALDIGCGEGWLVRALTSRGIEAVGIDVVPALVDYAQAAGRGRFHVFSYEEIAQGKLQERFDVAICNFSLLGKEAVLDLFTIMPSLLHQAGRLVIQTLHPLVGCGAHNYEDGWREGSWEGFSPDFRDPAPWYFRTLESWVALFVDNGFKLTHLREPTHPLTGKPVSLLLVGERVG